MAKQDLKVGIVGCGRVTEMRHLPVLLEIPGVEVLAIADSDSERLELVGQKFDIPFKFYAFDELVTHPDLDIVAVCVPAIHHTQIAIAALENGKHLFIEKPLALSLYDCDAIINKVQPEQYAVVGFNLRHHHLIQQAKRMVDNDVTGPIEAMRSTHTSFHATIPAWRERRQTGGGVLLEQAVHHIDLWRYLLDTEVEEVYSITRSGEWDDLSATIIARMENGVIVSSYFSEQTSASNEIEIIGRQGKLFISGYRFDGLRFEPFSGTPGSIMSRLREITNTVKRIPDAISSILRGGDHHSTFRNEWMHFCKVVRGEASPICTLEDGRKAVQVILSASESSRIGRPVKVLEAPASIIT
jgi:predicted dehydrogenase